MNELIKVLEASVLKYGEDNQLTLGHMLNLLKYAERSRLKSVEQEEQRLDELSGMIEDDRN